MTAQHDELLARLDNLSSPDWDIPGLAATAIRKQAAQIDALTEALDLATQEKYSQLMLDLADKVGNARADKLELAALKHDIKRHMEIASREAVARVDAEDKLAAVEAALNAFIRATQKGVEGGIINMNTIESRCEFYSRIDTARDIAIRALNRVAAAQEKPTKDQDSTAESPPAPAVAHTDHPSRTWDWRCPACNPENIDWRTMTVSELAAGNPSLKEYSDALEAKVRTHDEAVIEGMEYALSLYLAAKSGRAFHYSLETEIARRKLK